MTIKQLVPFMKYCHRCVFRYALETTFELACSLWVDTDLPLQYTFMHALPDGGSRSPLADNQPLPSYAASLPLGSSAWNNSLEMWAEISDLYGSSAEAADVVFVRQYEYGSSGQSSQRRMLLSDFDLTGYMFNLSKVLVKTALDASDPNACTQALGGVAAIINANNASDVSDFAARQLLRQFMFGALKTCSSIMELTTTTATQRASLLSAIASDGAELRLSSQMSSLASAWSLAMAVDNAGSGIDADAASAIGRLVGYLRKMRMSHRSCNCSNFAPSHSVLSSVLQAPSSILGGGDDDALIDDDHYSRRDLLSVTTVPDEFEIALNLTQTTKALCSSLLSQSEFAGSNSHVAKQRFTLSCYRESPEVANRLLMRVPTTPESIMLPSNFSKQAQARSFEFIDFRFVTFSQNLFARQNTSINGGMAEVSAYTQNYGSDLSAALSQSALITLTVATGYNTSFDMRFGTCRESSDVLTFECPLGREKYSCWNTSDTQFGTYFVTLACPRRIPRCVWWNWDSLSWLSEGCVVANYSTHNVTCECDRLGTFGISTNISSASVRSFTTTAPSPIPSASPTSTPSILPYPAPSNAPSPIPTTASPTIFPTPLPSVMPLGFPTLTPTDHYSVSVAITLTSDVACASYSSLDEAVFMAGLASAIDMIEEKHISETECYNQTFRRSLVRHSRRTDESTVTIGFDVGMTSVEAEYESITSGTELSSLVALKLNNAVWSGRLATNISSSASELGSDSFSAVVVLGISVSTQSPSPSPTPAPTPAPQCFNTDYSFTDTHRGGCETYTLAAWCGNYDNAVFSSELMCCACGGGSSKPFTTSAPTSKPRRSRSSNLFVWMQQPAPMLFVVLFIAFAILVAVLLVSLRSCTRPRGDHQGGVMNDRVVHSKAETAAKSFEDGLHDQDSVKSVDDDDAPLPPRYGRATATPEVLHHRRIALSRRSNDDQPTPLRRHFDMIDADARGRIEHHEVRDLLLSVSGAHATNDEILSMVAIADKTGDGCLTFNEFSELYTKIQRGDVEFAQFRELMNDLVDLVVKLEIDEDDESSLIGAEIEKDGDEDPEQDVAELDEDEYVDENEDEDEYEVEQPYFQSDLVEHGNSIAENEHDEHEERQLDAEDSGDSDDQVNDTNCQRADHPPPAAPA